MKAQTIKADRQVIMKFLLDFQCLSCCSCSDMKCVLQGEAHGMDEHDLLEQQKRVRTSLLICV